MAAPQKHKFVIWAPDYTDEEAPQRRQAVRGQHLASAKILTEQGVVRAGGAFLTEDTYLTETPKMAGSVIIVELDTIETVWKMVKEDVYYTGNVWDKDKLQVFPFKPAVWPGGA